jgi:hypothetical protein
MNPKSLQDAVCENLRCSVTQFERRLFWQCLYRHAVPLAFLIRWFTPAFFRDDLLLIQWIATDVNLTEIDDDLDRFEYGNRTRKHWLRTGMKIRLSSARVTAFATRFLEV